VRATLITLLLTAAPAHARKNKKLDEGPPPDDLATLDEAGQRPVEAAPTLAAPEVMLVGGTVLTAAGSTFEGGWVHLVDGLIAGVGDGPAPDAPDAHRIELEGAWVTPGLIDTHSHLGVYPSPGARAHSDGNEATSPSTPGVWAEHSFWPQDPGLQRALEGGVTTIQVLPGSANLVGGRGVVIHLVPTRGSRAMRLEGAPETLKMACGENPKRVYGDKGGPSTRMGNLRGQRQAYLDAIAYKKSWDDYLAKADDDPEAKAPDRDLDKETLVGVLEGRVLPQIHCYRADDMLSMVQLSDEMGFSIRSFHHALEAYKIRDVLAEHGIASSTWADWWGFKLEAFDGIPENAGLLTEAGARAIIHSDSSEGIQRLNQEASKAYWSARHAGLALTEEQALQWVTLNPAWALGVDDQVGTLEVGKRADVVVWDQHPFSVYASTQLVFVDGALVHDAAQDRVSWSDFELGWEVNR